MKILVLGTNKTKMAGGLSTGYLCSLIPSLLLTARTTISACKPNEKLFRLLGSSWCKNLPPSMKTAPKTVQ